MSEHPTPQAVADLLQGRLSRAEANSVVRHLLHGCGACSQALWPPVEEDAYEQAIGAVIAKAAARQREWTEAVDWLGNYYLLRARKPFSDYSPRKKRRLATWGLCDVLLWTSQAMRRDFPHEMVHLAEMAAEVAAIVPFRLFRYDQLFDLEARACGELANAYRVVDDLPQAEKALRRALARFDLGTHDPLLFARLRDIGASLFAAQRRFEDAYQALAEARAIYLRSDDRHRAGRTLIKAGLFAGYEGDPVSGIEKLVKGLGEIDGVRDPDLVFRTLHNIILLYVELENHKEALVLLSELRPRYLQFAGPVDRPKLAALEGKIAAGLGEFALAENMLAEARQSFAKAGLSYYAAVVGLELAAVWFRQGKTADLKRLVGELVAAFRSVHVEREALAALVLLHKAVARESVTLEQIERVRDLLGRLAEGRRRAVPSL